MHGVLTLAQVRARPLIRKARPDDLQAIVAMVGHFIQSTPYQSVLRFVPAAVTELADRVLQVGIVFVAEVDGRIVGMIAGFAMEEPIGRTKMLDELAWWVEPDFRRGTIGPKLLRTWEAWARQKGLTLIKMIAPHATPEVGRYYARHGYVPLETSYIKRIR